MSVSGRREKCFHRTNTRYYNDFLKNADMCNENVRTTILCLFFIFQQYRRHDKEPPRRGLASTNKSLTVSLRAAARRAYCSHYYSFDGRRRCAGRVAFSLVAKTIFIYLYIYTRILVGRAGIIPTATTTNHGRFEK